MNLSQRSLPPRPNLRQLKKQAKGTLKAYKARDGSCLPVVRWLRELSALPDPEVYDSDLSLNDVQLALALYYGFDGWANLKRHIENVEAEARAPQLNQTSAAACIQGLEGMDWGGAFYRRQDSYMTVLAAFLRCAGFSNSFEDVMGLSGGAFCLHVEDDLCPSAGRISDECYERAMRAFGLSITKISLEGAKNPDGVEALRPAVVKSIDSGLPVPYMDGEYSLIVGYKDQGRTYICQPYAGGTDGYREMEFPRGMLGPAWWCDLITLTDRPVERSLVVKESLQSAIEMARADAEKSGLAAYGRWITRLEDPPADVNLHGNAYCYAILLTSRTAAAEYLGAEAKEFSGDISHALSEAAMRYRNISERLLAGRTCTAYPREESWTRENRSIEAQIMRDNLADEEEAIANLEKAVAGM